MSRIKLNDLPHDETLDGHALAHVRGGLSGGPVVSASGPTDGSTPFGLNFFTPVNAVSPQFETKVLTFRCGHADVS